MIVVSSFRPRVYVHGGSTEERELHGEALAQHYRTAIVWCDGAPCEWAEGRGVTFAEAMASMHAEHSAITAKMYAGADSMWGVL